MIDYHLRSREYNDLRISLLSRRLVPFTFLSLAIVPLPVNGLIFCFRLAFAIILALFVFGAGLGQGFGISLNAQPCGIYYKVLSDMTTAHYR